MKRIVLSLAAAAALVAAAAVAATPAQATVCAIATTCSTTTQFTVTGGTLTINVPAGPINLGSGSPGTAITNTFTGAGGTVVTVSDLRSALAPVWTASVIAAPGAFVTGGGTPPETIPNTAVLYLSGNSTATTGTGTSTAGQPVPPGTAVSLDVSRTAFSHAGGSGNNTTAWDPTITINVPAQAVAGLYTGTINHSVA